MKERERESGPRVGGIFGEQQGSVRVAVSRGQRTRNPRAMPIFAHAPCTVVYAYTWRVAGSHPRTATQTQLSDNTVHDDHGTRG